MEIRLAEKRDVDQIVDLWKYMMDFHEQIDPYYGRRKDGHKSFRSFLKRQIGAGNAIVLLAEEQNMIVGFCLGLIMDYPPVFRLKKKGHINDMVVDKAFAGKGIGGKLLDKTLYWFKQVGIEQVELDVAIGNEIAGIFYRKHGFEVIMQRLIKKL